MLFLNMLFCFRFSIFLFICLFTYEYYAVIVKFILHGAARLEDHLVTSQLHVNTIF